MKKPRALFIGRWQPFHKGHEWLIAQKLDKGIPVTIAVRDVAPDDKNPLTAAQVKRILDAMYDDKDVDVQIIDDIESVNWGRGVGYEVNEHVPPADVGIVSATEIRRDFGQGNEAWKDKVPPKIHDAVLRSMGLCNDSE